MELLKERDHYRSLPTPVILEEARLFGITAEMAIVMAERLDGAVYQSFTRSGHGGHSPSLGGRYFFNDEPSKRSINDLSC